jgi:hypothetical protein
MRKQERPRNKNAVFSKKRKEKNILVGTVLKFFVDDCLGRGRRGWLCGNSKGSTAPTKSSHQTLDLSSGRSH